MKIEELLKIVTVVPDTSYDRSHTSITESELKEFMLYEGLISSVSRAHLFGYLKSFLNNIRIIANKQKPFLVVIELTGDNFSLEQHQKIIQALNLLSWFCSNVYINLNLTNINNIPFSDIQPTDKIGYTIEPKYDVEEDKLPPKLYHVTPLDALQKIKKIGLVPRSGNKQSVHPARIYFAVSIEDAKNIAPKISAHYPHTPGQYIILEIDTKSISRYARFFWDPNFEENGKPRGLYTLSNIPPTAIKQIVE